MFTPRLDLVCGKPRGHDGPHEARNDEAEVVWDVEPTGGIYIHTSQTF
jgi:hypothetical protein